MEINEEKACLCALNRIFGFTPKTALALLSHFGNASEIFRLTSDELDGILGPHSRHKGLITWRAAEEAAAELERLSDMDIWFTGWTEDDYPGLLRDCEDAPVGLYVRSTTPPEKLWAPCRRIAVVGTRDISPYGKEWCVRTVTGLSQAEQKPAVVSGLAIGTDFCAHKAALEYGLPTIAVMATGPESVYPYRHRQFAERMVRTPGCALVTDYPPGTAPLAIHFLRRNRIIAGLSDSTILIESKIKGGGMMTCRLAFSYNREVYALPGRADDSRSQGCNRLIRDKIAEPITSIEELTASLRLDTPGPGKRLSPAEKVRAAYSGKVRDNVLEGLCTIISFIAKERGATAEEMSAKLSGGFTFISSLTRMLELDGWITTDLMQRCFISADKFR